LSLFFVDEVVALTVTVADSEPLALLVEVSVVVALAIPGGTLPRPLAMEILKQSVNHVYQPQNCGLNLGVHLVKEQEPVTELNCLATPDCRNRLCLCLLQP
jgi:hypothetical protein